MERRSGKLRALVAGLVLSALAGTSCGGLSDEELRPVVLLTVRGLGEEVAGLRIHALLNNAPQKEVGEFFEGFGPGVVQQVVAVRLPMRAEGEVELTVTALTTDRCVIGRNPPIKVQVAPGALVPQELSLARFQDNMALCPLTISRTGGPGSVVVNPGGKTCTERCDYDLPRGTEVTLSTSDERGTRFLEWEGACTGDRPCAFKLGAPADVRARFARTLTVRRQWAGGSLPGAEVRSNTGTINCGSSCVDGIRPGAEVLLSVTSGTTPCFAGWGGYCKGQGVGNCSFKMPQDEAVEVDAYFLACESMTNPGQEGSLNSVWAVNGEVWATGGTRSVMGSSRPTVSQYLEADKKWTDPITFSSSSEGRRLWTSGSNSDLWAANGSSYLNVWRRRGVSWTYEYLSVSSSMNAVWGSAANDIWFVGSSGSYEHTNGSSIDRSGRFSDFATYYGIAGSGINDVWAVGTNASIQHWRGGPSWEKVNAPPEAMSTALYSVWAVSPQRAWAVGQQGLILQWDGARWQKQASGTTSSLYGVWATSPTDAWAVGENATVLRWDGQVWHRVPSVPASASATLNGIHGYDASTFFAVGTNGTIVRFRR